MGRDGAEVGGYGLAHSQRLLLSVQLRRDKFEVDVESLLVLDNLGLLGDHAHVGGIAVALVVDEDGKLTGNHGFDLLSQGIVAIEVALHEVGEVKFGRRLHRERHGIKFACHLQAAVGVDVAQCTAERVVHRLVGSSIFRRDEQDGGRTRAVGSQIPAALHAEVALEPLQALGVHLELLGGGGETCLPVRDVELQLGVRNRLFLVAVSHGQGAAEGLAGHRHRLFDLQRDGGAGAGAFVLQSIDELVGLLYKEVANVSVFAMAGLDSRLVSRIHGIHQLCKNVDVNPVFSLLACTFVYHCVVDSLNETVELFVGDALWLVGHHGLCIEQACLALLQHSLQQQA